MILSISAVALLMLGPLASADPYLPRPFNPLTDGAYGSQSGGGSGGNGPSSALPSSGQFVLLPSDSNPTSVVAFDNTTMALTTTTDGVPPSMCEAVAGATSQQCGQCVYTPGPGTAWKSATSAYTYGTCISLDITDPRNGVLRVDVRTVAEAGTRDYSAYGEITYHVMMGTTLVPVKPDPARYYDPNNCVTPVEAVNQAQPQVEVHQCSDLRAAINLMQQAPPNTRAVCADLGLYNTDLAGDMPERWIRLCKAV